MTEPWLAEETRQKRWDDRLAARPICTGCGCPILADRCLPLDGAILCPACVEDRMVEIEE